VIVNVCILALLAWDSANSKQLPFGARLRARRVKAKTSLTSPQPQTFLIDWTKFGNFIREEKSLGQSYIPPSQEETTTAQPRQIIPIFPTASEIKVDLDPITPIFTPPPVDPIRAPGIPSFPVDPVITPIFPNSPTEAPEVTTVRNCRIVTDTIEEDVEENQCQEVITDPCEKTQAPFPEPKDCYTTTEEDCNDVKVTELQEVCEENIVNVCEKEIQDFTRNDCRTVTDEKCESEYLTELKEECQYETVYENVCTVGYLVAYQEQCSGGQQNCQNIPKYPKRQCRKVPRIEGKCKKVPVKRPNNNCSPVERVICTEVPYQQLINKCVYTDKPICNQEQVEVVKNICSTVEKEICTIAVIKKEEDCQSVTENVCQTVLVPRTRIVEREVCDDEDLNSFFFDDLERSSP